MQSNSAIVDSWRKPSRAFVDAAKTCLGPWRFVTSPVFTNADRVPRDRPVMFIANHNLLGMLDTPLLMLGIYEHTGHFPRSLGDKFHFQVPVWRDLLRAVGVVVGSRDNCRDMMRQGHSLLIFPGGGREVFKRKGEKYKLIWGNRSGFARLALEFSYTIVPVAAVGAEDCYRIVLDENDLSKLPIARTLVEHAPRKDVAIPPIVAGLGGSFIPIPQRFYFAFGNPIEAQSFQDQNDPEGAIENLRDKTRDDLQSCIAELLRMREGDPERDFWTRARSALRS